MLINLTPIGYNSSRIIYTTLYLEEIYCSLIKYDDDVVMLMMVIYFPILPNFIVLIINYNLYYAEVLENDNGIC